MERVYLDYAASAPLAPEAQTAITKFLQAQTFGNPSSLHHEGRQMRAYLDRAHTTIASVFGFQPTEVVLTSGATESNNLAIQGVLAAWRREHHKRPHVILSAIEHPSWRQAVQQEDADLTVIPVSTDGVVSAKAVLEALQPETALVGCMYVNNELGTIQPIAEIGKGIETYRAKTNQPWPVFHVDAVQAFPYQNTHRGHMHADIVTISGHKYGALSGIGALLIAKRTPLATTVKGGSQEWGLRAGTENVLGAITLAAVVEHADAHRQALTQHVTELQHEFETLITKELPELSVLCAKAPRSPHITYLWNLAKLHEHTVHKLDLAGLAVSSGSACSSGAALPSSTLLALGYTDDEAFGGLRVSFGRQTTSKDIATAMERLRTTLG